MDDAWVEVKGKKYSIQISAFTLIKIGHRRRLSGRHVTDAVIMVSARFNHMVRSHQGRRPQCPSHHQ
jgi:hypothetical protein